MLAIDLRSRIADRLGADVAMIGSGERVIRPITVALVQSLDTRTLEHIKDLFEVIVVDEAHHPAAESYRTTLFTLNASRRYGFTATPDQSDGVRPFVHHHLGPVVHETSKQPQQARLVGVLLDVLAAADVALDVPAPRDARARRFADLVTRDVGDGARSQCSHERAARASAPSSTEVAFEVGYGSVSAFSRAFSRQLGYSPSRRRARRRDAHVCPRLPGDRDGLPPDRRR